MSAAISGVTRQQPLRESLPDAIASVFDQFAAATQPSPTTNPQIRTSEEWAALLSAVSSAGLLPAPELLQASRDLALPASLTTLQKRLNSAHEPPRATTIDGLLDGSVARVRHLHGLLAEWDLGALSAEHTTRLLAMLEALRTRLTASVAQLKLWHDGIHAALGPERCQSLFWDLIDPIASQPDNAHAYQRLALSAIEKRCASVRVKSVLLPGDSGFGHNAVYNVGSAFGSSATVFPSAHSLPPNASSLGFGVWSSATPHGRGGAAAAAGGDGFPPAIDVAIGTAADAQGVSTRVRVVRCPHAGVGYTETAKLLAWTDATKQLALSRHAPAYLGHEPCVPVNGAGFPAHARWHLELVGGATLADGLSEGGALAETSLLFRHWRREIIEGLCDLSQRSTFLLPHAVTLRHVIAGDEGCRVVFDHLAWGAEFPEPAAPTPPPPLQQALAVPHAFESAGAGGGPPASPSASSSYDISDADAMYPPPTPAGVTTAGGARAGGATASSPPPAVGHQALRDTLLLYDGIAMLTALLTGSPQEPHPSGARPPSASVPASSADAGGRSSYLSAILGACCHPTSPPTLKQLLSHPYFAPVEGFEREDVRAAYRRWRKGGGAAGLF